MIKIIGIRFSLLNSHIQKIVGAYDPKDREGWLEERINIFNKVTYPSLSQHEDARITMFLTEGDQWVENKLLTDSRFFLHYSQKPYASSCFMSDVCRINGSHIDNSIVLRMDSDDAISKYFFDDVDQPQFIDKNIVQPRGVIWDGTLGVEVEEPYNQFLTVYNNKTIYNCCPTCDATEDVVYLNKDKPMWLTYVHGRNVSNSFREYVPGVIDVSDFGI